MGTATATASPTASTRPFATLERPMQQTTLESILCFQSLGIHMGDSLNGSSTYQTKGDEGTIKTSQAVSISNKKYKLDYHSILQIIQAEVFATKMLTNTRYIYVVKECLNNIYGL